MKSSKENLSEMNDDDSVRYRDIINALERGDEKAFEEAGGKFIGRGLTKEEALHDLSVRRMLGKVWERTTGKKKFEVAKDAVFKGEKTFNQEEILDFINSIARDERIDPQTLSIERGIYDSRGNLLYLEVAVSEAEAQKHGYGAISYSYFAHGNYGKGYGFSASTDIVRVYADKDDLSNIISAGIVGKYENGGWKFTPGAIMPIARDVRRNKEE